MAFVFNYQLTRKGKLGFFDCVFVHTEVINSYILGDFVTRIIFNQTKPIFNQSFIIISLLIVYCSA